MTRRHMLDHAVAWVEAWNRRDLAAVLALLAEDARFTSPNAVAIAGQATLTGRDAIAAYWRTALEALPELEFALDTVVCDEARREMAVLYTRHAGGQSVRACEIMRFDEAGRWVEGEALYGG